MESGEGIRRRGINSFDNLAGMVGQTILDVLKQKTDSYQIGIWILATSMVISATIIVSLGIGRRAPIESKTPVAAEA
jgi:hypothetical protein